LNDQTPDWLACGAGSGARAIGKNGRRAMLPAIIVSEWGARKAYGKKEKKTMKAVFVDDSTTRRRGGTSNIAMSFRLEKDQAVKNCVNRVKLLSRTVKGKETKGRKTH